MYVRYVRSSLATVGGRFHGYANPTRSSGILTVSVIVPTNQLDQFQFWSIQRVTKHTASDTIFPYTVATTV